MSLNDTSKVNLLKTLAPWNSVSLTEDKVILSKIKPVGDTGETLVRLTGRAVEGQVNESGLTEPQQLNVIGTTVVEYRRRNLADLPGQFLVPPRLSPSDTTHALLEKLRDATGLRLDTDDVLDLPVTVSEDTISVTLRATDESYGWYGECVLTCRPLADISIRLTNTTIRWG